MTAICHIHSVPAIVAAENKEVLGGDPAPHPRTHASVSGSISPACWERKGSCFSASLG